MPLSAASPLYLHIFQNISLALLAILFIPLSTAILCFSYLASLFSSRSQCSPCSTPKRILVTGVGMSKGLYIARAFYKNSHIVIGADFAPNSIPVCGRFSAAFSKFYTLPSPTLGKEKYVKAVVEIVKRENVDIWVSCSGVVTAAEDGEAAEAVERHTSCKAVQFGVSVTTMLHEKHSFIENTEKLGLQVPETVLVTSVDDAMTVLDSAPEDRKYILKFVGVDDSTRADMTLLPRQERTQTRKHLMKYRLNLQRPFVLQQYVKGPEYCTHTIVIRGKVVAYTACESDEILMHYDPLPHHHPMARAMLVYTEKYVERMGEDMSGHFSIDFLVDENDASKPLMERIYPIECNPRAHTAVVNFGNETKGMVDAYLSILSKNPMPKMFTSESMTKHYWVGHDIVTRLLLPILTFSTGKSDATGVLAKWEEFVEHLVYWRDPTYEIWDPWPAWWLYCVFWPCTCLVIILKRKWWSRANVSTGKLFSC